MKNGGFATLRRQLARRFGPLKFADDDDGKLVSLIISERSWFEFYFILKR